MTYNSEMQPTNQDQKLKFLDQSKQLLRAKIVLEKLMAEKQALITQVAVLQSQLNR